MSCLMIVLMASCDEDDVKVTTNYQLETKVTVHRIKETVDKWVESGIVIGGHFEVVNTTTGKTLDIELQNDILSLPAEKGDEVKIVFKPSEDYKDMQFEGAIGFVKDGNYDDSGSFAVTLKDDCSHTYTVPDYKDNIYVVFYVKSQTDFFAGGRFYLKHK